MKVTIILIVFLFVFESGSKSLLSSSFLPYSFVAGSTSNEVNLVIDGITYPYTLIDWKKSHIIKKNGVKLRLIHPDLPDIYFDYSGTSEKEMAIDTNFRTSNQLLPGEWHLHFEDKSMIWGKGRTKLILFPQGNISVSMKNDRLKVDFRGMAIEADSLENQHYINGKIDLSLDHFR